MIIRYFNFVFALGILLGGPVFAAGPNPFAPAEAASTQIVSTQVGITIVATAATTGTAPRMDVYADGTLLGTATVEPGSISNTQHVFTFQAATAPKKVEIVYIQDSTSIPQSLNIYSLRISDKTYTPAKAVYEKGSSTWADTGIVEAGQVHLTSPGKLIFVITDTLEGVCGSANGSSFTSKPTTGLCGNNMLTQVKGTGPWTWSCPGIRGGKAAMCEATVTPGPVNGACGPANGIDQSSRPTAGLCIAGAVANFTGTGPWNWSCTGSNGGAIASCQAPLSNMTFSPIKNLASGLCLTYVGSGPAPTYQTCTGSASQSFFFNKTVDNYYQIMPQNGTAGVCIDAGTGYKTIDKAVSTQPCSAKIDGQKWVVDTSPNGYMLSTTDALGCLETVGESTAAGTAAASNGCYVRRAGEYLAIPGFGASPGVVPSTLPSPDLTTGLSAIAGGTMGYAGYLENNPLGASLLKYFHSLGLSRERFGGDFIVNNYTADNYNDQSVLNGAHAGTKPLMIIDWYAPHQGRTIPPESEWFTLGQYLATRYHKNSDWLLSQGIKDWGITTYEAFNEPDMARLVSLTAYHDALRGYANGIHSVDSTLTVISGGFASCNAYQDVTVGGYAGAIADLYNDGTLSGMDVHTYYGYSYFPIELGAIYSARHCFTDIKKVAGITADIDFYATEYQYGRAGPDGTLASMTETYAAQGFLAAFWDNMGMVKNDGHTPATKYAAPWNMSMLATDVQPGYALANQLSPYVPNPRGAVYGMLMRLTAGLNFDPASVHMDPGGKGEYVMTGGGKTLYVWQNWVGGWTNHFGSTYTVDIPAGKTHLDIYGWDGLRTSYAVGGLTQYTVTGLARNETHMFLVY